MILSVIILVYNKAPFVRRCLDSVAKQITDDVQVIVIDDGSTDGSSAICDDYKKYGMEIYHFPNGGVSAARNSGLALARGEYITFLDADDAYTDDALDVMTRMSRHEFNIIQFGQYRQHTINTLKDHIVKGRYSIDNLPRRWAMVWNKMYKKIFVDQYGLRFIEGMQFGEDEVFNIRAILANDGLYHAPQTLIRHYFDDKKSLCRGELNLERLTGLVETIRDMAENEEDPVKAKWLRNKARQHENSALFKRFGYQAKPSGKWDIVYFLKNTPTNEELRYSLRSVEENWEYNRVWFYGGCPDGVRPDERVYLPQDKPSKWENVRSMILKACRNDNITENFWLFNDDFFILRPISEDMKPHYNGTLERQIERVENRHGGNMTDYTLRLRHLVETLDNAGKPTLNYSVHKPILINRKKAIEVLEKFPDEPMFRALYGNYWNIGGEDSSDNKIMKVEYNIEKVNNWSYLSTSDTSFQCGNIGKWVRSRFPNCSRFEV